MALLAVAAAVCLTASGTGGLPVTGQHGDHRRVGADTDRAVASFVACLNEAAKTLAGATAAVVESDGDRFTLPVVTETDLTPTDDAPVVAVQPHVFLLNLPPPTTLS